MATSIQSDRVAQDTLTDQEEASEILPQPRHA